MRVQRMCRRLVLLLLAAACLCQMALAVDPAFRYGSKNVSWVEMDGDDFLLLDGDEADRDHPAAYAGDWMKVNLPMRTSIGKGVLQELSCGSKTGIIDRVPLTSKGCSRRWRRHRPCG